MNRTGLLVALCVWPLVSTAQAARLKMPDFSGLAAKATESVDISLDGDMLKNAGSFLGGRGKDDADIGALTKNLDGIYVKVFSFDKPGVYSMRDIESLVSQVESNGWKKLMSVREKDERVEMWMLGGDRNGGMFFVSSEPKELVLINIAGKVDFETLRKLQGRMGVPNIPGIPAPPAPPVPPVGPAAAAPPAPAPAAPAAPAPAQSPQ